MKTAFSKQYQRFLVKAITALAGLLVLAPQISYKFYLYANFPVSCKAHSEVHVSARLAGVSGSSLVHERNHRLHIDKRYTVKHLFALLPGFLSTAARYDCPVRQWSPGVAAVVDPIIADHRLRGPPVPTFI